MWKGLGDAGGGKWVGGEDGGREEGRKEKGEGEGDMKMLWGEQAYGAEEPGITTLNIAASIHPSHKLLPNPPLPSHSPPHRPQTLHITLSPLTSPNPSTKNFLHVSAASLSGKSTLFPVLHALLFSHIQCSAALSVRSQMHLQMVPDSLEVSCVAVVRAASVLRLRV